MNNYDAWMWSRFYKIKKYCEDAIDSADSGRTNQGLCINRDIVIAKKKSRFRMNGCNFWAHYTPKGLGTALKEGEVLDYYMKMLADPKSSENPVNTGLTSDGWKAKRGDKITEYELNSLDFLDEVMMSLDEVEY
jgi:hypothetical protein